MTRKVWDKEWKQVGTHLVPARKRGSRAGKYWIYQMPDGSLVIRKRKPKNGLYVDGPMTEREARMRLGMDV